MQAAFATAAVALDRPPSSLPLVLDGAECYTCTSELEVKAMKTWIKDGMATVVVGETVILLTPHFYPN